MMNNIANCSVRNKIWVASCITPPKCPVRDVIMVEAAMNVIYWENITYLTARQFAEAYIFYPYHIPKGIKSLSKQPFYRIYLLKTKELSRSSFQQEKSIKKTKTNKTTNNQLFSYSIIQNFI